MAVVTRVLFVCLGNICRSPTAEGVFLHLLKQQGLGGQFQVDSAGTGGWHAGESADARMRKAASRRGFKLTSRARQVVPEDFRLFDYIFAMDGQNLADLQRMADGSGRAVLKLLRDYDDQAPGADVPDPYYGGAEGFDRVLDIVERSCGKLLESLQDESRG